jgi:hypothetical protein
MPALVTSTVDLHRCRSFGVECWNRKGKAVSGGAYGSVDALMAGLAFVARQPGVDSFAVSAVNEQGLRGDVTLEARREFERRLDEDAAFNVLVAKLTPPPPAVVVTECRVVESQVVATWYDMRNLLAWVLGAPV